MKKVIFDNLHDIHLCLASSGHVQESFGPAARTREFSNSQKDRSGDRASDYQALFENMLDAMAFHRVVRNESGQIIDYIFEEVNHAFEGMTLLKRGEILGKSVSEVMTERVPSSRDWLGVYQCAVRFGKSVRCEQQLLQSMRWYAVSAFIPVEDHLAVAFEDITDRKLAEVGILESQRAIATILSNLPGMAYRCRNDHDWTMEYVSAGCKDLTGYLDNELIFGRVINYNDLIHSDDRGMVWESVQAGVNSRSPFRMTYRLITSTGETKWVWEQGGGVFDGNGELVALEGFISDITDRKRAEEALRSREEHFRALIDNSSDITTLVDTYGKLLYMSPSVERTLGYQAAHMIGRSLWEVLHPEDRARIRRSFLSILRDPSRDVILEVRIRHERGGWRTLEVVGRNLLGDPHVGAIVVNSRDITERRELETARAQLATAVEQATESIVITDLDGVITYVNSAFERVTGYTRAEAVGMHVRIMKSGEHDQSFYEGMWEVLRSGRPWMGRFKNRRKNGTLYEEECAISPIKNSAGATINFVAVKRDVTNEVELEGRLRQAQKLEAVGRLASGIAHDFNNLLAGIRGFAELVTLEQGASKRVQEFGNEIMRAATRAADLTSQLLAFARKGNLLSVPVNVQEVIEEVMTILRHTIDRRIQIRSEIVADKTIVRGDPSQLQSAILNLGLNARDAMPDGGLLTASLRNVFLDKEYCDRHSLEFGEGMYVALTISDTGVGIDEEVIGHIFDPFFTTKEQGQGTGLGLAGVYGCARSHHGCVDVVSEVGKGSSFTLYLPLNDAAELSSVSVSSNEEPIKQERILVVDDEDVVRSLAEKMLVRAGYRVITCRDGEEAIQLYRTAIHAIDLVLLDMMMPKLNGLDTLQELKKYNPNLRIVLMSGFSDRDVHELVSQGQIEFIQKPFQMKALLSKIRAALDNTSVDQTQGSRS